MENLAEKVKHTIDSANLSCFSLYAGYGMGGAANYVRFPTGVLVKERRNDKGRCIYALYKYADGSTLEFKYSTQSERVTLKVRNAALN